MWMFDRLLGKNDKKTGSASPHNKKDMYHCEEYGFSVYCPNGWRMHTQDLAPHVLVMFYDPLYCENNISIGVSRLWWVRSIEELNDVLKLYTQRLNAPGFEVESISLKSTKVGDKEAVERVYKLRGRTYKEIIFDESTYEYVFACGTRTEKFKDCKPIFDECLRSFKFERITDAETHYVSGVSYDQNRRYREAEEKYLEVIMLNPKYHKAYCNLGRICQITDRIEDAVKYYNKALEINPYNSSVYSNLGIIYWVQYGEIEEGLKYFCKAVASDPAIESRVCELIGYYSYHTNADIRKLHQLLQRGCLKDTEEEVVAETSRTEKTLYEAETYSNEKYGFLIKYPKEWVLEILEPKPEVTVDLNVWFGIRGKVDCSIMVGPIGHTIYGKTLQEIENRARVHRQSENVCPISSKHLTIDGIEAYRHVYTAKQPTRYVKQVGLFENNNEYLLLFRVYAQEDFERYEPVFDDCIQSFKFKRGD